MKIRNVLFIYIILISNIFLYSGEQIDKVNDKSNILTEYEEEKLEQSIIELKKNVGCEVVILIIGTTGNLSIEELSINYAEKHKIGRAQYKDGLLILVATEDRSVRIEVGYGLEKIIRDDIASSIIKNIINPNFKKQEYYTGLYRSLSELKNLIYAQVELVG